MTADTDEEEEREAQELTFLLEQRRSIALARESNASLQETLVETLKQAPLAQAELDGIEELLDLADAMHSYDTARSSILPSQPFLQASLPLFHGLEKVTSVAAEVSDLKALLLNSIWNKADDRCLEEAVLNQCRRLAAYAFKSDKSCRNPLALVAQMSDEELALLSLPKYLRPMQGGDSADESSEDESEPEDAKGESRKRKPPQRIDWDEISLSLSAAPTANAHTADACRTRWLMVARPGINDEPWSEKEIERLKTLVEKQLNTSAGNDRLDWHNVADEIGNGRRPIDCVIAYQRLPFVVRSAPHLSLPPTFDQKGAYDDELLRQASIWGHQWSLLAEKLNYNPSTVIDKFDTALESENEAREWDEDEIQRLREGIARQTKQVRIPIPRTQDEALPGSSRLRSQDQGLLLAIEDLNFERAARYVRTRTPKACRDRYANLIAPPATSQAARPLPEQPSSTGWTLSEERQLLKLREQHPEWLWVEIARTLTKGRTKGKKITGTMAIDRWMELKGLEGEEERQEIKRADTLIRGARDRKRQREKDALTRSAAEQRTMEGSIAEQQPATIQSQEGGDTFGTQPEPAKKKLRGQRQT